MKKYIAQLVTVYFYYYSFNCEKISTKLGLEKGETLFITFLNTVNFLKPYKDLSICCFSIFEVSKSSIWQLSYI